ncbi:MAG TPA: type II CAAX endopeptidase family protein [Terracidiphilus sp.]|nr:type II CAAX endopeptidase family protein [Terracidiphilus sp.]
MSGLPQSFPDRIEDDNGSHEAADKTEFDDGTQAPAEPPLAFPAPAGNEDQHVELAPPEAPHFDPVQVERPLFADYGYITPRHPPRIPNFGHVLVFLLILFGGYLGAGALVFTGMHFHVFGVSTLKQAEEEIHYRLGSQAAWYLITLLACVTIFPFIWAKSFFSGVEWRAAAAARYRWRLFSAALTCFIVAIADEILIPGPTNTPIDQTFRMPGAVWLLFGFGVTLAPLIEEIAFRGLLLPAVCTAYDWAMERITGSLAPRPDDNGRPRWTTSAMVISSVITSVPFALMHGDQTSYAVGPFLLLISVSLVLCWVRLATRSLAASVMVHSSYNLLLFALMFLGTGGFRHLDRM